MKKIATFSLSLMLFSTFSLSAFAADTEKPSDVENFAGTSLDAGTKLSWSKATDNVAVTGYIVHYGLTPVTEKGQKYDKNVDVKNVTDYTLTGLENGKKYYLSVVAYDAAGNESQNWANALSVTPSKDAGKSDDKDAPQVSDIEALNKVQVKVIFSEEIVLPAEDAQDAFTIENNDDLTALVVSKAEMDTEDKTNKTVILTTAEQKDKIEYTLTAGINVKDKAGNPIISGTSDTAVFTGSAKDKPADDTVGPVVLKVEPVDNTHFAITFDEAVVLNIDPAENFKIIAEDDDSVELEFLGIEMGVNLDGVDNAFALVKTGPQEDKNYVVTVIDIKDEDGNEISKTKNSATFKGVATIGDKGDGGTTTADIIAPKDVANFLLETMVEANKYIVTLKWALPTDSEWDSVIQQLYTSTDKGQKYEKTSEIAKDKTEFQVKDLAPGEYWFKLTQKDAAGNESAGVVTKVFLAETGPEMLGLVFLSLGLGRVLTKKKKK